MAINWTQWIPTIIGGVGSIVGSNQQQKGIEQGSQAALQASNEQLKFLREGRDLALKQQAPFLEASYMGLDALMSMVGLGRPPALNMALGGKPTTGGPQSPIAPQTQQLPSENYTPHQSDQSGTVGNPGIWDVPGLNSEGSLPGAADYAYQNLPPQYASQLHNQTQNLGHYYSDTGKFIPESYEHYTDMLKTAQDIANHYGIPEANFVQDAWNNLNDFGHFTSGLSREQYMALGGADTNQFKQLLQTIIETTGGQALGPLMPLIKQFAPEMMGAIASGAIGLAKGGPTKQGPTFLMGEAGKEDYYRGNGFEPVHHPRYVQGQNGYVIPRADGGSTFFTPPDGMSGHHGNILMNATGGIASPTENPGGQPGRYNFMTDPGYQFRINEGLRAIENSAFAKGVGMSGGAARGILKYSQDYASNEYTNVYNRIANIAGYGQVASQNASNIYSQYSQGAAGAAGNLGATMASAYQATGQSHADMWSNLSKILGDVDWGEVFGG